MRQYQENFQSNQIRLDQDLMRQVYDTVRFTYGQPVTRRDSIEYALRSFLAETNRKKLAVACETIKELAADDIDIVLESL